MTETPITTIKELTLKYPELAIELDLTLANHLPKRIQDFARPHLSHIKSTFAELVEMAGYMPLLAVIHDAMIEDIAFMYKEEGHYDIQRLYVASKFTDLFNTMAITAEIKS